MNNYKEGMYTHLDMFALSIMWLAVGIILMLVISVIFIEPTVYKEGQIDALTGNVKYHLVVNPDSTRTWKRIIK